MNPKPPIALDGLMWAIAESQDRQGLAEFLAKYPEHRAEMGKRFAMVASLKGSSPLREHVPVVPPFRRREMGPTLSQRRLVAAVAVAGVFALGYASFEVARVLAKPADVVRVDPVPTEPPPSPTPNVVYVPPKNVAPDPHGAGPLPGGTAASPDIRSIDLADVRLLDAVRLIADATGYDVEIAPGFRNVRLLKVAYTGVTGLAMLRDLGSRVGFTVFEQERRKLLLVPARDPNATEPAPVGDVVTEKENATGDSAKPKSPVADGDPPLKERT
ncbi:MAG: hypothetical protein KIS66_05875 [Fimbriimonadaceae bacterium]|nr:hypothetical protein [Fimbriimonadaceae bacterium]